MIIPITVPFTPSKPIPPFTPSLSLNDGAQIPQLGFGTWQIPGREATSAVRKAIEAGYRLIDTASAYENEEAVGEGIHSSGIPRAEIFVTTKLWNDEHGWEAALRGLDASLARLKLNFVDLYLIHWPVPTQNKFVESWRALIRARDEGKAKSIGVSNFSEAHLQRLFDETGIIPAVNQVELHPLFTQKPLRSFHTMRGIVTESWSPLGRGRLIDDPIVKAVAARHGRTPALIILRWHVDNGLVVIPKSVTPKRIEENTRVFDFRLSSEDLAELAKLDTNERLGPDPETFAMM
jgi:2,5-diketo-D-gluconate reductase A